MTNIEDVYNNDVYIKDLKTVFRNGVKYAKDNFSSILFDRDDKFFDYQDTLLEKAQTLTEVMNVIWMANYSTTWNYAFKAPEPVPGDGTYSLSNVQYGVSPIEWYFFYGITNNSKGKKYCYNITFIRVAVSPLVTNSDYNIWSVNGGYGVASEVQEERTWYRLKPTYMKMSYKSNSYSDFTLEGSSQNKETSAILKADGLSFVVSLLFDSIEGGTHNIEITMQADTPPNPNAPGTCLGCFGNLGSMYYSYTDMSVQMNVRYGSSSSNPSGSPSGETGGTGETLYTGKGWQDHQLVKGGIPVKIRDQALMSVSNTLLKAVTGGWTWYAIQDFQSNTQYMLTHFYIDKFYKDDIQSKLSFNDNIKAHMVNVYKNGISYFNPTGEENGIEGMNSDNVKILLTGVVDKIDNTFEVPLGSFSKLPKSYAITLPDKKQVVLEIATVPNIYPIAPAPYETPAFLKNTNGDIIGIGLIEANGYFTNEELAQRVIAQAKGDYNNKEAVDMLVYMMLKKQNWYQKLLSFIIAGIPLIAIIASMVFIFHKKDERKFRAYVSLLVCVLLYFTI
jgi:hypothetical protein